VTGRHVTDEPASGDHTDTRPTWRIVAGTPTDEELAALVGVLATRAAAPAPVLPTRSRWRDRAALVGAPASPGPGAWRASGLPR